MHLYSLYYYLLLHLVSRYGPAAGEQQRVCGHRGCVDYLHIHRSALNKGKGVELHASHFMGMMDLISWKKLLNTSF